MSRATLIVAAVCALVVVAPAAANAAYYNTYTTVATLGNAEGCTADEGFAVGSTYTYSVKINSTESKAVIYRTKMSDGTVTLMSNGDTGTDYATYLGHANDVALMSNGGNYYMYVVTMNAGSTSLVKLQYIGATYYRVGSYTITSGGTNVAMSGVKIVQKDTSDIYFLFKSGTSFYRGMLGLTATGGSIPLSRAFTVDIENAQVNGSTVSNIDSYSTQGIGYYNDKLYFVLTLDNVSIVLVYDNILALYNSTSPPPVIGSDSNLSFRITSSAYPYKFEIEGVGVASGVLWFSANRQTSSSDLAHDGVFYFNDYIAS